MDSSQHPGYPSQSNICQMCIRERPEAAHDRTDIDVTPDLVKKDDDIMDNDDEWK